MEPSAGPDAVVDDLRRHCRYEDYNSNIGHLGVDDNDRPDAPSVEVLLVDGVLVGVVIGVN
jgi:hypothetical protein